MPRSLHVDLLRVIAMMMVIFLHTILNFAVRPDFFATPIYFLLEPISAVSKTCVLLFFMLSGYLVIQKQRSFKQNTFHTLKRIGIPLLFFTGVNVVYALSRGSTIAAELRHLLTFPSSPLWFLEVLFVLYLLNPIWHHLFSRTSPRTPLVITVLFAAFSIMSSLLQYTISGSSSWVNVFTAWVGFVVFYLYGGLVRNNWVTYRNRLLNSMMLVVGFVLTVLGDYLTGLSIATKTTIPLFDYTSSYQSIPVILMAIGIFNLVLTLKVDKLNSVTTKIIEKLTILSFGIYLIHSYVVTLFIDIIGFDFNKISMNPYLFNLINVGLVLGISVVVVSLVKKIPVLRYVIGG